MPSSRPLVTLLVACGSLTSLTQCGDSTSPVSRAPDASVELELQSAVSTASARSAYIAARQAEGARLDAYRVSVGNQATTGTLVASNRAMQAAISFEPNGVKVAPPSGAWGLTLRTERFGCESAIESLVESSAAPLADANRVTYERSTARGAFTEWYVNGPLGLEQGFTLRGSPCATGGTIVLELDVGGLQAAANARGDGIDLRDASGVTRIRYTDLFAHDATGAAVPATMSVVDGRIALRVQSEGATFPLTIDPLAWLQQQKLVASDGVSSDSYGSSVAVAGDTAIVGAYGRTGSAIDQGVAYILVRSGPTWTEQAKLGPAVLGSVLFGASVAIEGDSAIIGAPGLGSGSYTGLAWVWTRTGTTWTQQGELFALDEAANDGLGESVSISGNTAIVGAWTDDVGAAVDQGSAVVFVRSGTSWSQQTKIIAADGAGNDHFGHAVAVSGNTAIIGAYSANGFKGSAYVYVRSGTTWSLQQKLLASDGAGGDQFGYSVALSGNTAFVGAIRTKIGTNVDQGSAYVYTRSGTVWSEKKLNASDGAAGDRFGNSVAISATGNRAVVGAFLADPGAKADQGAAYVYLLSGGIWAEQQKIVSGDGLTGDNYGNSVSVSNDTVVVGAQYHDIGISSNQGAAYVYYYGLANGVSCVAPTDCVSSYCTDGVCCDKPCAGACDACSVAAGATTNGVCIILPAGSAGSPACSPLACLGTSATCASCTTDTQCASDNYCAADGTCKARKALTAACNVAAGSDCKEAGCRACTSGFCADGICCDKACAGACDACTAAKKGSGVDGACAPVAAGTDPRDRCPIDVAFPASCGADGLCDGASACRAYAPKGTACGATTCTGGSISGKVCSGAGSCNTDSTPCAPFACGGSACKTTCAAPADCAPDAYCTSTGVCAPKAVPGTACTAGTECASDLCVDGVCCKTACTGQCEACGETGTAGTCVAVSGAPRGKRKACDGDAAVCGGTCDGTRADGCKYAAVSKSCGNVCKDGMQTPSNCDGAGSCAAGSVRTCSPFACADDKTCATTCTIDTACAAGFRCQAGTCVPSVGKCTPDGLGIEAPDGKVTACGATRCKGGKCIEVCTSSSDDCAPTYLCNSGTCQPPGGAAGDTGSSGGCAIDPNAGDADALPLVALAGLALLGLRRRRARQ